MASLRSEIWLTCPLRWALWLSITATGSCTILLASYLVAIRASEGHVEVYEEAEKKLESVLLDNVVEGCTSGGRERETTVAGLMAAQLALS